MFYFFNNNKLLVQYVRGLLQKCLKRTNISIIKLLFFDTSGLTQKDSNTATTLVTSFICTTWYNRENYRNKIGIFKNSIIKKHGYQKIVFKNKMPKIFNNQYCKINMNFLDSILTPDS